MHSRGKYLVQLSLQKLNRSSCKETKQSEENSIQSSLDRELSEHSESNSEDEYNESVSDFDSENDPPWKPGKADLRESTSDTHSDTEQLSTRAYVKKVRLGKGKKPDVNNKTESSQVVSENDPPWKPGKADVRESTSDTNSDTELLSNRTYVKKVRLGKGKPDVNNNTESSQQLNLEREKKTTDIQNNYESSTSEHTELITNTITNEIPCSSDCVEERVNQSEETYIPEYLQIDHEEEIETENLETQKRKRNRVAEPKSWIKNVNKRLRMKGKTYQSIKKETDKTYSAVAKGSRVLEQRGCTKRCFKGCKGRMCLQFTEQDRREIFESFWENMDWQAKKVFVISLVDCKQCNGKECGRRGSTYLYNLKKDGVKLPVCKSMFLSTLAIGEKYVYTWIDQANKSSGTPGIQVLSPRRKPDEEIRESARQYLEMLPKLPSHYCRSNTSKVYVEPTFTSFAELYTVYREFCTTKELRCASRRVFSDVFNDANMSLFKPKKDQCDICCGFETGNTSENTYNEHIIKKEQARREKAFDKQRAQTDESIKVVTVDLQAVLLAPFLQASAMYYKTKLACHNYTIYDLHTKDVTLYFWHEGEGDLTAILFASCLTDYIEKLPQNVKEIIIYSDGCTYQNRNSMLANALLKISTDRNIIISQKYLTKGHTQMECDSVHSTLEIQRQAHL